MRLAPGRIANTFAWLVLAVLAIGAVLIANHLGFVGLLILGSATWLVCNLARLDQRVPTWGEGVFREAMRRPRSDEERAAAFAEQEAAVSPFRFYGWCGAFLAAVGAVGFIWQLWATN